jgi:DNA-binding transcriptional regulator YiaG
VSNHPNRSQANRAVAGNPKPAEILRAREDAGLTQQQAADLLFSSWRTWQNWEAGERRMPPSAWELFNAKINASKMIEKGEITEALLRRLGIYLPPE